MAKSKRDEMSEAVKSAGDEGYEFKMPAFDEKAFIRRELQSARASFYTLGLGVAAGVAAVVLHTAPISWQYGWLPLIGSMVFLRPLLQKLGFGDDVTSWKALIGSYFMAFFTGLGVWMLGVNIV